MGVRDDLREVHVDGAVTLAAQDVGERQGCHRGLGRRVAVHVNQDVDRRRGVFSQGRAAGTQGTDRTAVDLEGDAGQTVDVDTGVGAVVGRGQIELTGRARDQGVQSRNGLIGETRAEDDRLGRVVRAVEDVGRRERRRRRDVDGEVEALLEGHRHAERAELHVEGLSGRHLGHAGAESLLIGGGDIERRDVARGHIRDGEGVGRLGVLVGEDRIVAHGPVKGEGQGRTVEHLLGIVGQDVAHAHLGQREELVRRVVGVAEGGVVLDRGVELDGFDAVVVRIAPGLQLGQRGTVEQLGAVELGVLSDTIDLEQELLVLGVDQAALDAAVLRGGRLDRQGLHADQDSVDLAHRALGHL